MWNSLWITLIFGIIYLVLIQYFPKKVIPWAIGIGGLFFVILGILVMTVAEGFILIRLIFGFFFIFLGILCCYSLWNSEYRKAIILCGRLIECSTEILNENRKLLIFIPVFIFLLTGLIFLTAFQILGVWSVGELHFDPSYPFYELKGFGSGFLSFLIFVEFFWGMSFLK